MKCVQDSATAQHMEIYDERRSSLSDYRRRTCLSSEIDCAGVVISGKFESADGEFTSRWIFFKVDIN